MLYRDYLLTSNYQNYKESLTYLLQKTLTVGSYIWEICLFFVFCIISGALIDIEGFSLITHVLIGLLYLMIIGRRSLFSSHGIFSLTMLPCAIPGYVFCIFQLPELISSDAVSFIDITLWIAIARWPLFLKRSSHKASLWNILKKLIFFWTLQSIYGLTLQFYNPSIFEPLEWRLTGVSFKPNDRYPSATGIQFFYEDYEEAEKIEEHLPQVIETLKNSPFYRNSEELVFVQKNKLPQGGLIKDLNIYPRGGCNALKQYSYYFSEPNKSFPLDLVYYSHNDHYRSIPIHELTHQLVSRYYGKWLTVFSVETWKNEGYAEYMANTGCYLTKDELWAMIDSYPISDEILASPFSKFLAQHDQEDYMAAFLQVRYALDVKKLSPIEFMKRSYKLASVQEIKEWLKRDNDIN